MTDIEIRLHQFIKDLYREIKNMHPENGLSSPRDIELAKNINKKTAIMNHLQKGMRIINPNYEIRN